MRWFDQRRETELNDRLVRHAVPQVKMPVENHGRRPAISEFGRDIGFDSKPTGVLQAGGSHRLFDIEERRMCEKDNRLVLP